MWVLLDPIINKIGLKSVMIISEGSCIDAPETERYKSENGCYLK